MKRRKTIIPYITGLPGCIAIEITSEEVEQNMHESIAMHGQGLLEDGLPIPKSDSFAEYVAI